MGFESDGPPLELLELSDAMVVERLTHVETWTLPEYTHK